MMNLQKLSHPLRVSGWKSSFFILALIVITGLLIMFSGKSSADIKYKYYLNFLYQDMRYNLRVNDVSLLKELDPKGYSISLPVSHLLKKGWNTIELDYAAYGKKSGKREYTDKFRFKIILNEIGYEGEGDNDIYIFEGKYDHETEAVYGEDLKSFENSLYTKLKTDNALSEGVIFEKREVDIITKKYKPIPATRLVFRVYINDDIPDPVWINGKIIDLESKDRDLIIKKYKEIHDAIEHNDFDYIYNEFSPVWDKTAAIMQYKNGAREFVKKNDAEEIFSRNRGSWTLLDYDFYEDVYKFEVMGYGKVIRILPDRMVWISGGDTIESKVSPAFFIDNNGTVKIADVITDAS